MALRPPVVQTIGVNTTAQWWWGSKIQRNGAEFRAAVVANRLSRTTQRTGSFRSRTNGDGRGSSTAGGGFGPRRPVVVGASIAFRGPEMVRTRSRRETMVRRQGDSILRKPIVVNPFVPPSNVFAPVEVKLAPSPRDGRRSNYRLAPPFDIIEPVIVALAAGGPGVRLTTIRPPAVHSKLSPPQVVTPAAVPFVAEPVFVKLAPSSRGRPQYRLGQPLVVYVQPINFGPGVRLAPQPDQARKAHPRLSPPAVVTPLVVQVFFGPKIKLAPSTRLARAAHSRLPEVVYSPRSYDPIQGYLTKPLDRVPPTISRLSRPTAVTAAPLAPPITVTLVRIRPFPTDASVFKPAVIAQAQGPQGGIGIQLAPQRRGTPKSNLSAPAVVTPVVTVVYTGPSVNLTYSKRGRPQYRLGPPVVVTVLPIHFGPNVTLAPSPKQARKTHPRLSPPTVVTPGGAFFGPSVTLAYSSRGKPKSILRAPEVVYGAITLSGPRVRRASRRTTLPVARWKLSPPTVVRTAVELSGPEITLVRIRPPRTLAVLRSPVVISGAIAFGGPRIRLTNPLDRVPATMSRLGRPTVTVSARTFSGPQVTLAPSRRVVPKSILREPVVVGPVLAPPLATTFVRIRPVAVRSRLEPPTVVFPFFARPTSITLVRIRPVPTRWLLRRPTDLVDQQDLGFLRVHLAYSLRGKPKSRLEPPTVVGPVLARPILVKLTRIRPVATRWELKPPTVVRLAVELSGPEVTLVRIRPPRTMSMLREPVAGAAQLKAERDLRVTLAYQSRGKPKSKLRPPVVVTAATPYFRELPVTLAPQRRGKAKSFLRPPAVVRRFVAAPVAITLAPSRRGTPRSFLNPPTDLVDRQDLGEIRVTLAPQRRGRPKSRLFGIVYAARVYAPIRVTLAPSRFPTPKSSLKPPTVVTPREVIAQLRATLTRIRPQRVHSTLRPPTVIDLRPQTFFLTTTLVRIRPPRTHWLLKRPTVEVEVCYGVVVGFDFGPDVCGTDDGATISGSESASTVSGSDSGATVQGASAAGGSVTGGDERTEGC